ncbi:hypothetical protein CYMTET_32436 [Cymbomonas tetramitiformis]|uniref:Uncharacterized protein n=1 Tax=Cymbomonas tetramitiformis TaxID=36881 RepID=A0AAE0FF38_9CHLO|nr:hypothetical protein CYMTET_32436 [Cymbomonas tetramitiformis]
MNAIETKKRNLLSWDKVEKLIYVKHNALQMRKRRRLGQGSHVIPWTEGTEEVEWVDAWQEEVATEADFVRSERVERGRRRGDAILAQSAWRVPPEPEQAEAGTAEPSAVVSTVSGRTIRRPNVFTC